MTYVFCPECEDGEIEIELGQDSDGDGYMSRTFTTAEVLTVKDGRGTCSNGCELTERDLDAARDKAIENDAYYKGGDY